MLNNINEFDNLADSMQRKINFKNLIKTLPKNHPTTYFWDVPITFNDIWVSDYLSMDSGPLAGISRFYDAFSIEPEKDDSRCTEVPEVLKNRKQWIWVVPDEKSGGRYEPYLCRDIGKENALSADNWIPYIHGANDKVIDGIAYVLNDDEITENLRLVAIHISPSSGLNHKQVTNLWLALCRPYFEYSRFNGGWTILGLVRQAMPTFESDGIKIFTTGDFVELSGLGAKGDLKDITDEILALHAYRFPLAKTAKSSSPPAFTIAAQARLADKLKYISADCDYSTYIRVVWAILSSGWPNAEQIALDWSKTALHRFEQDCFDGLVKSFNPTKAKSPTFGTIYHLAREGGWHG